MGFMAGVGKALLGVGKAIGKAALGIGGGGGGIASGVLGAIGQSGTQGTINQRQQAFGKQAGWQDQQQQQQRFGQTFNESLQRQQQQQRFNQQQRQLQQTIERPEDQAQRLGLVSALNQELNAARREVFGPAQKAAYAASLADLAQSASKALQRQLGASGGAAGGALASGVGDIEAQRFGQLASFYRDLPMQEALLRSQRMSPLFSQAIQLAGLAPRDIATTGETTGTTDTTGTIQSTSLGTSMEDMTGTLKSQYGQEWQNESAGEQTTKGPSFWRNLATNFGGILAGNVYSPFAQATNSFKLPGIQNPFVLTEPPPNIPYTAPSTPSWLDAYIKNGSI